VILQPPKPIAGRLHKQTKRVIAARPRGAICLSYYREGETLIQAAVEVPELRKMQEIVTMLANLRDAAHQLPEGTERQNALREISGYQIRMAAFVRRLGSY
jgi:hypothetical protein